MLNVVSLSLFNFQFMASIELSKEFNHLLATAIFSKAIEMKKISILSLSKQPP